MNHAFYCYVALLLKLLHLLETTSVQNLGAFHRKHLCTNVLLQKIDHDVLLDNTFWYCIANLNIFQVIYVNFELPIVGENLQNRFYFLFAMSCGQSGMPTAVVKKSLHQCQYFDKVILTAVMKRFPI